MKKIIGLSFLITVLLFAFTKKVPPPEGSSSSSVSSSSSASSNTASLSACYFQVSNRGKIPKEFLNDLLVWAKAAPNEIFAPSNHKDVYNLMAPKLGPFNDDLKLRKAAMVMGLAVHAGLESSWDYETGIDTSKPSSLNTCSAAEAGIFQPSFDSVANFGGDLKVLFNGSCNAYLGSPCIKFQKCSKDNHTFAIEYTARLLRHLNGYKHFGPFVRGEVQAYLSRECTAAIYGVL
jgi:hypothetical protein